MPDFGMFWQYWCYKKNGKGLKNRCEYLEEAQSPQGILAAKYKYILTPNYERDKKSMVNQQVYKKNSKFKYLGSIIIEGI